MVRTERELSPRPRHVHLDPLGGISGDMFLAALLDAWPEATEELEAAIHAAGLPADWRFDAGPAHNHVLTGTRVTIDPPASGKSQPTGAFREIRKMLQAADLETSVSDRAITIFSCLARAEAEVHGIAVDDVHFHELADWDSIADIVGAAFLIDWLGAESWSTAPLPLGRGRVTTAHGPLPVPAPATAKLLQGFEVIDDGIPGERVTPTGAAILAHLAPATGMPLTPSRLTAEGTGFGSRTLPGISNVLRVLGLGTSEPGQAREQVAVVSFEVDDQTPEDLAVGLDRLRQRPGVLDVLQAPAVGKKGRQVAQIRLLARPESVDSAIEACFVETTTIGLRWRLEERQVLARRSVDVATPLGTIDVKVVDRPGVGQTAKADVDGVRDSAANQAERTAQRNHAELQALKGRDDDS